MPQCLAVDETFLIIEMSIVTRPYVLDFAGAYLDSRPDFPADAWEHWEQEKREQFGPSWPTVRKILDSFEMQGVFLLDISPSNIAFFDETGG